MLDVPIDAANCQRRCAASWTRLRLGARPASTSLLSHGNLDAARPLDARHTGADSCLLGLSGYRAGESG
jgi:hypothetical protein